jgi:hypothetical protein
VESSEDGSANMDDNIIPFTGIPLNNGSIGTSTPNTMIGEGSSNSNQLGCQNALFTNVSGEGSSQQFPFAGGQGSSP